MPATQVHSAEDEKKWERAKQLVHESYPEKKSEKDESFWKIVSHIYNNMKKEGSCGKNIIRMNESTYVNDLINDILKCAEENCLIAS